MGEPERTCVAFLTRKGLSERQIEQVMTRARSRVQRDRDEAELAVEDARAVRDGERQKHLLVGGLWFAGGLLLTLVTFSAASGGGHYVLAWGPMVYGAIRMLRAL